MKLDMERLISLACIFVLAGCSQGEQKTEPSAQSGATTGTETGTATGQGDTGKVYEGTMSGVISDSMCGSDHTKMGDMGKDPIACTHKCVESGAKYVLVDSQGIVYNLSDQDKSKDLAGKPVKIEGHIDPANKSIHVHSVTAE